MHNEILSGTLYQACVLSGYLIYYFFLTAYTFMTIVCIVTYRKIRHQKDTSDGFYRKITIAGYSFTAILTMMMAITQSTAPCSHISPKFGDHMCFFEQKIPRLFWFYIPIIGYLIINGLIFGFIVHTFTKLKTAQKKNERGVQDESNESKRKT